MAEYYRSYVLVAADRESLAQGAGAVITELHTALQRYDLQDEIQIIETSSLSRMTKKGPELIVYPEGTHYVGVYEQDVDELVEEHLLKGRPLKRLISEEHEAPVDTELGPPQPKEMRGVLRRSGQIDPESIDDYIMTDGYMALGKAVTEMTPQQVIDEVAAAGLRGRGGAGFPTARKWQFAAHVESDEKFFICNGDEGDPGAFMDRRVMESDPHAVLEGMAIGGYAIGASQGYIYVRAEYPLAVRRLNMAIEQAKAMGILGDNIFGSSFSFDVEVRMGAGAFVCGEETALMASIEGKRGEPRPKPPFPAVSGLWGKPTIINNVETIVNVPPILLNGAEWFATYGTGKSKGTKTFTLAGKIRNSGLIEVPMGITLREIIYDIGGGIPDGKQFKAVQTGGPSGGCLTEAFLDTPVDFDSLVAAGSMMGSGGMIIMDEDTCMVDVARYFLDFCQDESCGKCVPCRVGTRKMLDILERICQGDGEEGDIARLEQLAAQISTSSLCMLGKTAPNPVISTLKHFRQEYEAHIYEKRCPAKVCTALLHYEIDPDNCVGCTLCARRCPVQCISGERKQPHVIDQELCIHCGQCFNACRFDAVKVT
ncbi:NADH-quinone oxidoreductase subunit NuoF [candidate division KSB3 bacterium]|uniref:NADH-quinone oxidoreductase subunit NuoF n=1 Tax=candidate division KSB3 bacterium TaxID=2044937 RepID=A0A9D5JV88_9BACT|nr:NADH-quinone oxidoreductase subunit NuoF [candidate division KSB3 bacterium]MBD3324902.1 NADH-quinone oxidoreductase subunit NuoF [candidate division KSB3 bacterium]